jgi:hypothetical protein
LTTKIYIPDISFTRFKPQDLFTLTRPFLESSAWGNNVRNFETWNIENADIEYTGSIEEARIVLVPLPVNDYHRMKRRDLLEEISGECVRHDRQGYALVAGDWGKHYPELKNITFLRLGGYRSKLDLSNTGIPVFMSDHYEKLYQTSAIVPRVKNEKATIGFCGHASLSPRKYIIENLKVLEQNYKRLMGGDGMLEPFFPSAYWRATCLKYFESNTRVQTNFIYRPGYKGGARTLDEEEITTRAYFENMIGSDYVFCLRGAGNFSVRFYETLMCGRIPVFMNTDCILPQTDTINWKKHVVWVEWGERKHVAEKLADFHQELHPDDFKAMQLANRKLWKEELSVNGCLKYLINRGSESV